MAYLPDLALYSTIFVGVVTLARCVFIGSKFVRAQIRKRQRNPVRVRLPSKLYYEDDLPPGYKRINSWDDLRHITRH